LAPPRWLGSGLVPSSSCSTLLGSIRGRNVGLKRAFLNFVPLLCCYRVYHPLGFVSVVWNPHDCIASKIMDVLHNRSSRLEMVMHLLSVVVVNGRCGCYLVGGAHGAQTRRLIIPRYGLQLVFSCFLLDLARNGREAFCRSIVGYRPGVLYPCWQYNL
jgi:hypothetical protein